MIGSKAAASPKPRAPTILRLSGSLVFALGSLVLFGWWLGLAALTSVAPGAVAMKANAALGLLLAGSSLLLAGASNVDRWQPVTSALAWLVMALGVSTLGQDLLGIDLGFDELLFSDAPDAVATGSPGRMSPASSAAFALLGIALAFRNRVWINQISAGLVGLIGAGAFVSYLYAIDPPRDGGSTTAVAMLSGFGFLAAATGALFAGREGGLAAVFLDESEPGRQLRLFFPVAIVLPLALGTIAIAGGRAGLWATEYEAVILSLSTIASLVLFAALSYRSFSRSDRDRLAAVGSLAASEERYRRTFQHATVGIAHLASDGRWIRVNDRICEILGYSSGELLSKTYAEVSHIEDLDVDVKQWELLRRGEIADYGVERRFLTKEGEVVFADVRLVRENDEEGDLQHFIVVLQDITGRKLSEGTLRVYQRAVSATQNGIVIVDATRNDQPMIYVNPAFLEMTGFEQADLIGQNCRILNRHARDQAGLAVVRDAVAAGEETSVLLRNHRKDDTPFWNQLSIAPVHDDGGRLTHFVGIAIDATERVDRMAERERLLTGAERANQEKDRFLSVVSHEMRSPMNAILAWASILAEEEQSDEVVHAAEAITASVQNQARLVDDLLEVSRMRAGTLEIQAARIDFPSTIESVVDQLTPVAREHEIDLVWNDPGRPVFAHADPDRLAQVLRNLIDNALKFTPGGGRIEIALVEEPDFLSVEVRDSGKGIAAEELERVFDDFWQGDRRGGSGGKGLGLGLPIVRHLVERQGGTIVAESAGPGSGATFRLRFRRTEPAETPSPEIAIAAAPDRSSVGAKHAVPAPVSAEAAPADSSAAHTEPRIDSVEPTGSPDRPPGAEPLAGLEVVVVDDDVPTVEASASMLASAGALVRPAHSVSEALRHFERGTPDVLVSDIGLPDRDGMDLIREVRSLPGPRSHVLALAVTGYADEAQRRQIGRAGFDAYLTKPVAPGVILDRLLALRARDEASKAARRRVLLIHGGDSKLADMVASIEAEGHDLRELVDVSTLSHVVERFEPEIVLVSSRIDGIDASTLGARLRAGAGGGALLVAVLEEGDQVELADFDYLLTRPGPDRALRRMLRVIEVSGWAK